MRALASLLLLGVLCCASALALFELVYREQWVDTYHPELRAADLALEADRITDRRNLLVMGDSFSVGPFAYPEFLRNRQGEYRIVNSAVSGTGVIEALIIAPRRFEQFEPAIFVYQVYVGNDLLNIHYPVNWEAVSPARNVYWMLAHRFRSLAFLNYRLGQTSARAEDAVDPRWPPERIAALMRDPSAFIDDRPFDPDAYTRRAKIYLGAEPRLLESQILLRGQRRRDFEEFLRRLEALVGFCEPPRCRAYVLLIPHACQVGARYLHNLQVLGARFSEPGKILSPDYPFATELRRFLLAANLSHVRVLDARERLVEGEAQGRYVYHQNDAHLSPYGQHIVAEYVQTELGL